jgi:hypothetical protein
VRGRTSDAGSVVAPVEGQLLQVHHETRNGIEDATENSSQTYIAGAEREYRRRRIRTCPCV